MRFWWYLKDTDVGWKKKPKLSRRKLHWHMSSKTATLIWIPPEWKEKGSQIRAYRCLCSPSQPAVWYVYSSSAAPVCSEGRGLRFISVLLISRKWWWPGKNLPHTQSTHRCCTAAVHLPPKHFCAASVGWWMAVLFKGQTQTRDTGEKKTRRGTDHSSSHFSAKVASKSDTVLGMHFHLLPFYLLLPSDLFTSLWPMLNQSRNWWFGLMDDVQSRSHYILRCAVDRISRSLTRTFTYAYGWST